MNEQQPHIKQIFETDKRTIWRSTLWLFRIIFLIFVILIASFAYSLFQNKLPLLPLIQEKEIDNTTATYKPTKANTYTQKVKPNFRKNKFSNLDTSSSKNKTQIRACFYVPWDPLSYNSLKKNIDKINCILPEWFFLGNDSTFTIKKYIDERGLKLMQDSSKQIIPILSNFDGTDFSETLFIQNCNTAEKRSALIAKVISIIKENNLDGINIDFEEITNKSNAFLIAFEKELFEKLHPLGYITTIDVQALNDAYDCAKLQKYNDYIFAMAYDENNSLSEAGPVAEELWMEEAVEDLLENVPNNKIILCMPTYGYDWADKKIGKSISYIEALSLSKLYNQKIKYNSNDYNLSFTYEDSINNNFHEVFFADACTNFNAMRYAADNELAGVSIWRLGLEDNRIWNFYNLPLDANSIKNIKPDYNKWFSSISNDGGIDYIGEGEILDVIGEPTNGNIEIEIDSTENIITEQNYKTLPSGFIVRKIGKKENKLVLTFDDGPDPEYTPQILKILKEENVPATFFIVGLNAQNNIPIIEDIYNAGFEIGNHSLTHLNMSEASPERALFETNTTRSLIESITGHSTILFRPPYNADSQPETQAEMEPVARCKKENYYTIAENIDPTDWKPDATADSIVAKVLNQVSKGNIILLHDAGGNRDATIKALPIIIQKLKDAGYSFTTVADLMGKTKEEIMPTVSSKSVAINWNYKLNYWFANTLYWITHILAYFFIAFVIMSIARSVYIGLLAIKNYFKSKNKAIIPISNFNPFVSVLIPAYNEELNILRTIESVLKSTYKNLEIIFVNDGSNDSTLEKVISKYSTHKNIKIITKENGGKASALNVGIENASYEIIICIDSDSQLKNDAIEKLVPFFANEKVGAVAGSVKVGNEINLITRWQSIEYITSQNFDRRAFDELNGITVVPGAIGAFRKKAIIDAGFYTSDTLAEDCDLSIRILKCGYIISNCADALSYTEAPETFKMFLRQRFRWNFGVMQSFWKNKKLCFNPKYKALGMVSLPNVLIFQIILPIFAPFVDIILLWAIINGHFTYAIYSYFLFMLLDLITSTIAFSFQRENLTKLIWILPQRIIYRQMMYYVLFQALRRAIKGETQSWGKLKRTGNVNIINQVVT